MANQTGANASPLYMRIYPVLKQRIEGGEWNYGAMLPSETELSEIYHVSRGTVRQVLSQLEQDQLVSRERGRGTFVTHPGSNHSTSGVRNQTISFIVPYVHDSFVSSILLGLEREARANGYAVVFSHFENDPTKQEQALRNALAQGVMGIVLYPVNSYTISPTIEELVQNRFPLVLVDRYLRHLDTDYVTIDNFSGGLIATQHLLSMGHKKIAFVSWTEAATSIAHRRVGHRQAMFEAQLPSGPELEWEVEGYPEVDQIALEERLRQPDRPSAVFAANDQLAIAVQRAARSVGLAIPDELALVGFDDLEISSHLDIPLTTVAQPAFEIGRVAWEILAARFHSEPTCTQKRILPVQLIVRQSCGALKTSQRRR